MGLPSLKRTAFIIPLSDPMGQKGSRATAIVISAVVQSASATLPLRLLPDSQGFNKARTSTISHELCAEFGARFKKFLGASFVAGEWDFHIGTSVRKTSTIGSEV